MFVQIIDARTTMPLEELAALRLDWEVKTEGRRTLKHSILLQDRADTNHILIVAYFDDVDAAKANSDLPETGALAALMMEKALGAPTFTDFDVREDVSY